MPCICDEEGSLGDSGGNSNKMFLLNVVGRKEII